MTCARTSTRRSLVAAGLVVAALFPTIAAAQDDHAQRSSLAIGAPSMVLTRLNTPARFYGPLPTIDAVKAMVTRPGVARDLEAVFRDAGIPYLASQAMQVLSAPNPGELRLISVPVGQRLEWMAQRRGGQPSLLRSVEWRGSAAFEAYEFTLDDGIHGYRFVLPTACGNLALMATGPSPRAEADLARRAEGDARRAEDARKADESRRAAEAKAAEDARRADDARRAEAARRAEEARRAEDARAIEEARQAEAARQTAAAAERDRRARVDAFVAGFGGKERRVRQIEPAVGSTPAVLSGRCSGLAGVKAGPDLRLGRQGWRLVPAIGVAFSTRDTEDSGVFAEVELNYTIGDKGFVGTGAGVWDLSHRRTRAGTWLIHFGREVARSASDVRLLLVAEGRLFVEVLDDIANNYQAWAGLRVVFR